MIQDNKQAKPSHFTAQPYGSVLAKSEAETIARNIMVILKRTGDTFRPFTWDEYKEERLKDGGFEGGEQSYFNQVICYCKDGETAASFSPIWKECYAAIKPEPVPQGDASPLPKWKVLQGEIIPGTWEIYVPETDKEKAMAESWWIINEDGYEAAEISKWGNSGNEEKQRKAFAEYAVLATNNFQSIVEALEGLLNKIASSPVTADIAHYRGEVRSAKAALQSIS